MLSGVEKSQGCTFHPPRNARKNLSCKTNDGHSSDIDFELDKSCFIHGHLVSGSLGQGPGHPVS